MVPYTVGCCVYPAGVLTCAFANSLLPHSYCVSFGDDRTSIPSTGMATCPGTCPLVGVSQRPCLGKLIPWKLYVCTLYQSWRPVSSLHQGKKSFFKYSVLSGIGCTCSLELLQGLDTSSFVCRFSRSYRNFFMNSNEFQRSQRYTVRQLRRPVLS